MVPVPLRRWQRLKPGNAFIDACERATSPAAQCHESDKGEQ